MEWAIVAVLAVVIIAMASKMKNPKSKAPEKQAPVKDITASQEEKDYTQGYKSKWMFTYNEKDAFNKIKTVTDEMGLYLFAKVRLFDLIEPKQGIENRTGHQWKIQAKHVDFVICDQKLVARAVIEYDDASHDSKAREERDTFVDNVLTNCGYKVLHMRNIEAETLKNELSSIFKLASANT